MPQRTLPHSAQDVPVIADELLAAFGRSSAAPTVRDPDSNRNGLPDEQEVDREVACVADMELSPVLQHWINEYDRIGQRDVYLWKWCWQGVDVTTLPCVPRSVRHDLTDTKVLGVMLDVLLDDVADLGGDQTFLDYLLEVPFTPNCPVPRPLFDDEIRYAAFVREVWDEVQRRVRLAPRYEEFRDLMLFDYRQLFNSMRYSHLINSNPSLLNLAEHDLYLPHNMHMMVSSTIDLMHSPDFDSNELGKLREVVVRMQHMGRIGNLITTWEREIADRDFTSGIFAALTSSGTMTAAELRTSSRQKIAEEIRLGGFEDQFLQRWQEHRNHLLQLQPSMHSVNVGSLVKGLDRLICLHLGSRGFK